MWLNLAAERGTALATWGLYLSNGREGEARGEEGGVLAGDDCGS